MRNYGWISFMMKLDADGFKWLEKVGQKIKAIVLKVLGCSYGAGSANTLWRDRKT